MNSPLTCRLLKRLFEQKDNQYVNFCKKKQNKFNCQENKHCYYQNKADTNRQHMLNNYTY